MDLGLMVLKKYIHNIFAKTELKHFVEAGIVVIMTEGHFGDTINKKKS